MLSVGTTNMNVSYPKYFRAILLGMLLLSTACTEQQSQSLPNGFVFLSEIDPSIIEFPRYYTNENFLGKPVPGYTDHRIISTLEAATVLKLVHQDLKNQGYTLVVYDGYRPQQAVDEFVRWSQDERDQAAKQLYYPTINKKDVFKLGYVAEKSSHSRGSTFDLTMIKTGQSLNPIKITHRTLTNGEEIPYLDDNTVDMGSTFDLFHEASHHDTNLVNEQHTSMRNLLRSTMKKYGFKEYHEEWWHYTLENEPYPDTYFNFVVK